LTRVLLLGGILFPSVPPFHMGLLWRLDQVDLGSRMRPLTSGVFQRLMAEAFPEIGCGWEGAFSRGAPLPVLSATSVRCTNGEVRK
jgi:hypothetical protein